MKWKYDSGEGLYLPACISSGDINGDGTEEYLFPIANCELAAISDKDGSVVWKKKFDAPVSTAYIADVNVDGAGELVVEFQNGWVRIYK